MNRFRGFVLQTLCFAAVEVYRTDSLFRTFWERKRLHKHNKTSSILGFATHCKTHKAERITTELNWQSVKRNCFSQFSGVYCLGYFLWCLKKFVFHTEYTYCHVVQEQKRVTVSKLTLCLLSALDCVRTLKALSTSEPTTCDKQLGSLRSKLLVVSFQLYWA